MREEYIVNRAILFASLHDSLHATSQMDSKLPSVYPPTR